MRIIKFLGLTAALAAVSATAGAQGGRRFIGIDDFARVEAQHLQGLQMHRRAMMQGRMQGRMQANVGAGQRARMRATPRAGAMRGQQMRGPNAMRGQRAGAMQGRAMGMRGQQVRGQQLRAFGAGRRMGFRAGVNATPAQKEFVKQFTDQRTAVRAQVLDGKLTREQARTQMQAWAKEHRPK